MKKIAVFASGRGSNFEQICLAEKNRTLKAKTSLLIASKENIGAIKIAQKFQVPFRIFNQKDFTEESEYNFRLLSSLTEHEIDIIALAGWLKLIDPKIISRFKNRIINIHPALLPFFGGKGMYGHHVHQAVYESGMLVSGATVHFVNEEYDKGKIIAQKAVQLSPGSSPQQIATKVLEIEHQLYPFALNLLATDKILIKNDRIYYTDQE